MMLPSYLGLLVHAEHALAASFRQVAEGHAAEPDIHALCHTLASQCDHHEELLSPIVERYGTSDEEEPDRLHAEELSETRSGPVGMLRDLQDLYVMASLVDVTWMMVKQAGQGLRDSELLSVVSKCEGQTKVQLGWLTTRMKQAAPQALIVAT